VFEADKSKIQLAMMEQRDAVALLEFVQTL
jgi:hypothetical protein